MTTVPVRVDADQVAEAARAIGIDDTLPLGDQVRTIMRHLAGAPQGHGRSKDGAALKRAGRDWERKIAARARDAGFSAWDVAPLRGRRDLLDITGTLPDGLLVGAKAIQRGVNLNSKLWDAMAQCHRALENLPRHCDPATILPVQVLQRSGADVGAAYAVTEWDWLLRNQAELVSLRRERAQ